MGVEARCCPSKSAAHCRHMKRQPFLHGCPHHGRLLCHHRRHLQLAMATATAPSPSPSLSQLPIAVAAAVGHCCGHREPSPPPSLLRCRQPLLLPSPLLSDIAVSIIVGHRSCHCRRPSPLPCRWPFPRVVALVQQELYSTNQSKECLPYFILLGQWAVY